jgi:hypothetical protein
MKAKIMFKTKINELKNTIQSLMGDSDKQKLPKTWIELRAGLALADADAPHNAMARLTSLNKFYNLLRNADILPTDARALEDRDSNMATELQRFNQDMGYLLYVNAQVEAYEKGKVATNTLNKTDQLNIQRIEKAKKALEKVLNDRKATPDSIKVALQDAKKEVSNCKNNLPEIGLLSFKDFQAQAQAKTKAPSSILQKLMAGLGKMINAAKTSDSGAMASVAFEVMGDLLGGLLQMLGGKKVADSLKGVLDPLLAQVQKNTPSTAGPTSATPAPSPSTAPTSAAGPATTPAPKTWSRGAFVPSSHTSQGTHFVGQQPTAAANQNTAPTKRRCSI